LRPIVSTVKKSVAQIPAASDRRNSVHVGPVRRGAGSWPARSRIVRTVVAEILIPSLRSPWGSETSIRVRSPRYDRPMWSLVYLLIRTVVALFIGTSGGERDDGSKDLEILVLPWGSETRIRSRRGAMVLMDEAAEQVPAANVARTDKDRVLSPGQW
jgi:hypothetical protein